MELLPLGILFIFCALYKIKFCRIEEITSARLERENTLRLKGILCGIIILDHLVPQVTPNSYPMELFHKVGFLAVAVFFLLSGYGVETQRRARPGYLANSFLPRKACELFIPVFFANAFCVLLEAATGLNGLDLGEGKAFFYIFDVTGHYTVNGIDWYIKSLFLLLVLYWAFFRFLPKWGMAFAALVVASAVITVRRAFIWQNSGSMGLQSFGMLFCFAAGVAWANVGGQLLEKIKAYYWQICCGAFGASVIFIGLLSWGYGTFFAELVWRNLGTVCFVFFVCLVMLRLRLTNRITAYMGKISMEVYLLHMWILWVCLFVLPQTWNATVRGCMAAVATIPVGILFHILLRPVLAAVHRAFAPKAKEAASSCKQP